MAVLKCKMCGGNLEVSEGMSVCECAYCGTRQTVPSVDNEKKISLFRRANKYRASCEFDKASVVYENIIAEFPKEAEAYWGLVLCKYGIEYVDDPKTGKKIPTCHRMSYDSVTNDSNYKTTLQNADVVAKAVYKEEVETIETIRKDIFAISSKEKPYDIFICYKETDEYGDRTTDSVKAQEIYYALTEKGYGVFFSRITLEDKLGTAYEPYIFSALNTAKVMLVVCTESEYVNAVWVKNEWSRFLKMISADKKKTLIPCYMDIPPYDLPREFSQLQGLNMSKIGFLQDLIGGITKIICSETLEERFYHQNTSNLDNLFKRAELFLQSGNFEKANEYYERIVDQSPENCKAYFGKFLIDFKLTSTDELNSWDIEKYKENSNYRLAFRFANKEDTTYLNSVMNPLIAFAGDSQHQYEYAKKCENDENFEEAFKWYQKSAEQGLARGQNNLGYMYEHGQGVVQDYIKAVEWYQKSAERGNSIAQNNLGYMYENGQGVIQNYTKAIEWYQKAAKQGNTTAKKNLESLRKKLGVCPYCGGTFTGIFKKKCQNCGRVKDYK